MISIKSKWMNNMNIDKNKIYQLNLYANTSHKVLEPNNQMRRNEILKKMKRHLITQLTE